MASPGGIERTTLPTKFFSDLMSLEASSSESWYESLLGEALIQVGVITAVVGVASLFFLSRKWGHASALQQSTAEAEQLRKKPKAFAPEE